MDEAAEAAFALAKRGDAVLLSPPARASTCSATTAPRRRVRRRRSRHRVALMLYSPAPPRFEPRPGAALVGRCCSRDRLVMVSRLDRDGGGGALHRISPQLLFIRPLGVHGRGSSPSGSRFAFRCGCGRVFALALPHRNVAVVALLVPGVGARSERRAPLAAARIATFPALRADEALRVLYAATTRARAVRTTFRKGFPRMFRWCIGGIEDHEELISSEAGRSRCRAAASGARRQLSAAPRPDQQARPAARSDEEEPGEDFCHSHTGTRKSANRMARPTPCTPMADESSWGEIR